MDLHAVALVASLLLVSRAMELSGALNRLGATLARASQGSPTRLQALLVLATALTASVATNDASIAVFAPLAAGLARANGLEAAPMVAAAAIAANIGSSLTPIGNPQNIIVWQYYGVHFHEFVVVMTPLTALGLALLLSTTLLHAPRERGRRGVTPPPPVRLRRALLASGTGLLVCDIVLAETGHPYLALALTLGVLGLTERDVLSGFDYAFIAVLTLMYADFSALATLIPHGPLETLSSSPQGL